MILLTLLLLLLHSSDSRHQPDLFLFKKNHRCQHEGSDDCAGMSAFTLFDTRVRGNRNSAGTKSSKLTGQYKRSPVLGEEDIVQFDDGEVTSELKYSPTVDESFVSTTPSYSRTTPLYSRTTPYSITTTKSLSKKVERSVSVTKKPAFSYQFTTTDGLGYVHVQIGKATTPYPALKNTSPTPTYPRPSIPPTTSYPVYKKAPVHHPAVHAPKPPAYKEAPPTVHQPPPIAKVIHDPKVPTVTVKSMPDLKHDPKSSASLGYHSGHRPHYPPVLIPEPHYTGHHVLAGHDSAYHPPPAQHDPAPAYQPGVHRPPAAYSPPAPAYKPQYHPPVVTPKPQYHPPVVTPKPKYLPIVTPTPQYHPPVVTPTPQYHPPVMTSKPHYHHPVVTPTPQYHQPVVTSKPKYHLPIVTPTPQYHPPVVTSKPQYHPPVVTSKPQYHSTVVTPKPKHQAPIVTPKSIYHQPAVSLKPQYQSPPVYTAPTPVHHQEAAYSPPAPKYQAPVVTSKSISHEPAVSLKPQYHGEAEPEVNPNPSIILKGNSDVSFLSPLIHASHHQERFTHKSSSKMLGKVLEEFKNRSVLSLMGGGFKVSGPYYVVTPEPETERHSYHGSVSFPQ